MDENCEFMQTYFMIINCIVKGVSEKLYKESFY